MKCPDHAERVVTAEIDKQLAAFGRGSYKLKVPAPLGLMKPRPKSHFHFTPEVFLQISGCTDFNFPHERMRLLPGEMCVLAVGLPHAEVGRSWRGPFLNLVIDLAPTSISWHLAKANADGTLQLDSFRVVQTSEATRVAGYLADLVEVYHSKAPAHKAAVRGLFMTFLAVVRALMEGPAPARVREAYKVTQCRHYILQHIGNSGLNVKKIAARIECSAGYLSNLFRQETAMTLISYLQRQRVSQAKSLLDSSSLNMGEVGRAVGYDDPGYFCRVFRRITGQTPKQYRNRNST